MNNERKQETVKVGCQRRVVKTGLTVLAVGISLGLSEHLANLLVRQGIISYSWIFDLLTLGHLSRYIAPALIVTGAIVTAVSDFIRPSGLETEKVSKSVIARPVLDILFGILLALLSAAIAINANDFPYVTNPVGLAIYFSLAFALAVGIVIIGIISVAKPRSLAKANLRLGVAAIATGFVFLFAGGRFAQTGAGDFLATGFAIFFISVPFILFGIAISVVSRTVKNWSPTARSTGADPHIRNAEGHGFQATCITKPAETLASHGKESVRMRNGCNDGMAGEPRVQNHCKDLACVNADNGGVQGVRNPKDAMPKRHPGNALASSIAAWGFAVLGLIVSMLIMSLVRSMSVEYMAQILLAFGVLVLASLIGVALSIVSVVLSMRYLSQARHGLIGSPARGPAVAALILGSLFLVTAFAVVIFMCL